MSIKLEITEEKLLSDLTNTILLKALDDAGRERIIAEALRHLTTRGQYGHRSPLEQAFDAAINTIAREIADRVVREDPRFRERVEGIIRQSVEKALNDDKDIVEVVARQVTRALTAAGKEEF